MTVRERSPIVDALFFAVVFTVTFSKLQWSTAWAVSLSDVLTAVFLAAFVLHRLERFDTRFARCALAAGGFFAAFLGVYLLGFFNLETAQALEQWGKGMVKFLLHFLFLVTALALVTRKGERFYWQTLAVFCAGLGANALYGVAQLAAAELAGTNLDAALIEPITGRTTQINVFGAIEGASVYRPNALTGDPNHLGILLLVPLLVLLPMYLRLEKGHRWRPALLAALAFGLVVELATLSRSGLLGLACGLLVLLVPYRRRFLSAQFLLPLAAVALLTLGFVATRADFFERVLRARLDTSGQGASTHFVVYDFSPDVLSQHPLLGLGLNNFAVYYEFVTGRTNFGPHSYYVALFVETGLVGAVLFAVFIWYLFRRLALARRLGRALAVRGDALAARVRPLAWGLTAALVGTLAANAFYLTISFNYFFVLALLAIAPPAVFGARLATARAR